MARASPVSPALQTQSASPATLYAQMDAAGIPEAILDTIARQVHADRFQNGVKQAIHTLATPFERALQKTQDFTTLLNRKVSYIFVEGTYDFLTVVLETNSETFIVYHYYRDRSYYERLVMEIVIDAPGEDGVPRSRLLRFNSRIKNGERVFDDYAVYRASEDFNIVPFHYLEEIAQLEESALEDHLTDAVETNWRDPVALLAWFERHEDAFESLTEDYRTGVSTPIAVPATLAQPATLALAAPP